MNHRRQGKIERTQAKDGEGVRGVDDEGVLGDLNPLNEFEEVILNS
ncbi:hypothetical protein FBY05_1351 [Pseudomonas sp. SJZ083]|nr:hypothetical protein FBY05_1351 [Pseudomonas sp. SJZ083]TWC40357.1 hypothetical protein FBY01_1351 [Pseudomonas sp. SJZ077]